jgi:hypothetical protein
MQKQNLSKFFLGCMNDVNDEIIKTAFRSTIDSIYVITRALLFTVNLTRY